MRGTNTLSFGLRTSRLKLRYPLWSPVHPVSNRESSWSCEEVSGSSFLLPPPLSSSPPGSDNAMCQLPTSCYCAAFPFSPTVRGFISQFLLSAICQRAAEPRFRSNSPPLLLLPPRSSSGEVVGAGRGRRPAQRQLGVRLVCSQLTESPNCSGVDPGSDSRPALLPGFR